MKTIQIDFEKYERKVMINLVRSLAFRLIKAGFYKQFKLFIGSHNRFSKMDEAELLLTYRFCNKLLGYV